MRGGLPPPSPLSGCIDGETEGDRLLGCPAPGSWPPERVLWLEVGGWRQADPLPDTQRSGALFFARCAPPAIHACCRGRSALAGWMRASARARRTGLLLPCLCSDPPSRPSLSLRRGRPSCFCASTLATTHHSSTLWCFGHRHEWSILPPACLAPAGHTRLVGLVQRGRGSRRDLCGGRGPYKMWRLLAAVRTLPCLFLRGGGGGFCKGGGFTPRGYHVLVDPPVLVRADTPTDRGVGRRWPSPAAEELCRCGPPRARVPSPQRRAPPRGRDDRCLWVGSRQWAR